MQQRPHHAGYVMELALYSKNRDTIEQIHIEGQLEQKYLEKSSLAILCSMAWKKTRKLVWKLE